MYFLLSAYRVWDSPQSARKHALAVIRYLGVLLYDADKIEEVASTESEQDLYKKQLEIFLDPNDPEVIAQARRDGVDDSVIEAAQQSPVYKLAVDWQLALPLHPEYRTLPMVWYVPPLSPIQQAADAGHIGTDGVIPDVDSLRIPLKYLANLLTAGDEAPVKLALKRLLAMRAYKRAETVHGEVNLEVLEGCGPQRSPGEGNVSLPGDRQLRGSLCDSHGAP